MDDLLTEFLTEATESLDVIDLELVKFERDPNNAAILSNIFRLVHTIKGTCGFLGLSRLDTAESSTIMILRPACLAPEASDASVPVAELRPTDRRARAA